MPIHHIQVQKTARYATHGQLSKNIRHLWFACHGYGQLVEFFIRKFHNLDPLTHFVVAPEALSRFYQDGFTGRVGATWMTRLDREDEIADYLFYLDKLADSVLKHPSLPPREQIKVHLFGFSQGTATISRWAYSGHIQFDRLILWSGGIAHDVAFEHSTRIFDKRQALLVYGKQDELIKQEQFEAQVTTLKEKQIPHSILTFEGKHEIPPAVFKQIIPV